MFRLLVFLGITLFGAVAPAWSELSHKVEKGETLFALSRKYGVSLKQIQEANPGLNPQNLKVGQTVRIPEPASPAKQAESPKPPGPAPVRPAAADNAGDVPKGAYRVQAGDTLSKIATKFGVTASQLRVWNDLPSDRIVLGRILRVAPPDAASAKGGNPAVAEADPAPVSAKQAEGDKKAARVAEPAKPVEARAEGQPKAPEYFFVSKVKSKIDGARVRKGRWKYIVVHHSGTRNGNLKIFDYYHRHRGMENGVAYHFVIGNGMDSGDGEIEVTNRWKKQLQGGHLASEELNEVALGICLVGDFNKTRPTRKQIAALVELIDYISRKTGPRPKFMVHREINPKPTDCPGKYFPAAAMHRLFDGRN